ncbi:MAG TPA: PspA/IM30 family protein [Amnibacterium sp.]
MKISTRLRNLFRIKANRALDRVDDPRESLDDSYDRQVDMLAQLRRGLAEVATARKRIELQGEEIGARYERLGDQAQEAMDQGREDLARVALERRSSLEQEIVTLRGQFEALRQQEEHLTENERRMTARVAAFRTQKETLKASYTASSAQVKANESVAGISADFNGVGRAVDQAKDKVRQMQARAAATDELIARGVVQDQTAAPDEDLDHQLAAGRSSADIERQLQAMREQRRRGAVEGGSGWLGIGRSPSAEEQPTAG